MALDHFHFVRCFSYVTIMLFMDFPAGLPMCDDTLSDFSINVYTPCLWCSPVYSGIGGAMGVQSSARHAGMLHAMLELLEKTEALPDNFLRTVCSAWERVRSIYDNICTIWLFNIAMENHHF